MRCPFCGQRLADGVRKCPSCGAEFTEQDIENELRAERAAEESRRRYEEEARRAAAENNNVSAGRTRTGRPASARSGQMPMKWFKYLIYFSLFLTCISNIITAVSILSGYYYGSADTAALMYVMYPGMLAVDRVYAAALIAYGVAAVVVRNQLAHYRRNAPRNLLILYVSSVIIIVIYLFGAMIVTGVNMFTSYSIISMLSTLIMAWINKIYFDKRAHLFYTEKERKRR